LQSGGVARIGHICGKKLLGDTRFLRLQRDLEVRQRREQLERFVGSNSFNPAAAGGGVGPWRARLTEIADSRASLRRFSPRLYSELVDAAQRSSGKLYQEREHVERTDRYGQTNKTIELKQIHIYTMRGPGWLAAQDIETRFIQASTTIASIVRAMDRNRFTDEELQKIVGQAETARNNLRYVADAIDAFDVFCHPDNLRAIAIWALTKGVEFSWITGKPTLGNSFKVCFPRSRGMIDRASLEHLRS
jgi:hypothetical protein